MADVKPTPRKKFSAEDYSVVNSILYTAMDLVKINNISLTDAVEIVEENIDQILAKYYKK